MSNGYCEEHQVELNDGGYCPVCILTNKRDWVILIIVVILAVALLFGLYLAIKGA